MPDAENNLTSSTALSGVEIFFIALLVAIPYIVIGLLLLAGAGIILAYNDPAIIYTKMLAGWAVGFVWELWLRRHLRSWRFRLPWFSLAGLCLMMTLPLLISWFESVALLYVPRWNHISQAVEWNTSKPSDVNGEYHSYYMVLEGYGHPPNHKFTWGRSKWTGDEPAGMRNINFEELTFPELCNRIHKSGLPDEQVDHISEDIWSIIQQARAGKPVKASYGQVEPVRSQGYSDEGTSLGVIIWMILLVTVFQFIGYKTIPRNQTSSQPIPANPSQ